MSAAGREGPPVDPMAATPSSAEGAAPAPLTAPEPAPAPPPAAPALLSTAERAALASHLTAAEVLRRAHRRELLPLAEQLGVPHGRLGRDALAAAVYKALRAVGSHDLSNLVRRGGQPPPWEAVLSDLSRSLRLPAGLSPGELERRLAALAPPGRAPRKTGGVHWLLIVLVTAPLRVIFGPLGGLLVGLWLGRRREDLLLPAIAELYDLRKRVEGRVIIALMGPPSVGKDAAMKAIFGVDTGNIDPVAGSTTEVTLFTLPAHPGVCLVNTPGLGDVDQRLTEETRSVLQQVDLTLYMVNAQGGVRQRERDEFGRVRAQGRPCLVVVNKLDTLRPADRDRMLADVREKLQLGAADGKLGLVGCAFDPLPALAAAPIGVDAVRAWLRARLTEKNKPTDWLAGPVEAQELPR